ncbi:hypothetical protein [Streptomyces sp. NBC_00724]|uniref:hypothetical protein n=1 Tax=Streptomyces sp. NBC_00724 TaxID=2975812 RepID=UPI002ED13E9B|nr:hypothetical protein OHB17_42385 [Streptomyces sp. NBC_00724]
MVDVNVARRKTVERTVAQVRGDETLLVMRDFATLTVAVGSGAISRPGGVVAVTTLRTIVAQDDMLRTSLPHPVIANVLLTKRLLRPSVLVIDAGPLGQLGLIGKGKDLNHVAGPMSQLAATPIGVQPESRLVPDVIGTHLACAECRTQQQDDWDPTPVYCHGCLRSFTWSDSQTAIVAEFRQWMNEGADLVKRPHHLWDWTKTENAHFYNRPGRLQQ